LRCGWQPKNAYAALVFETPGAATGAYEELIGRKCGNFPVRLSWEAPNTIVYIMNINPGTPSTRIGRLLHGYRLYGALVRRPHMMIAAFRDPEEARIAVSRLQGTSVDGELLQFSILQGQRASEFVGYDRLLSCYMCLRTLASGARTVSITATPPLPLSLAVESPSYYGLTFNLGENPQITLCGSRVLPTVTSHDIALRIRYAGQDTVEMGPRGGAGHFIKFMKIFRADVTDAEGGMDFGVVLENPLDTLKVETFFGKNVPPASPVVPEIIGEPRPYHGDTTGESSGVRENGGQRGNVLYSGASNKPGPSRRASAGGTSNQPAWPGVSDMPSGKEVNRGSKPHGFAGASGPGRTRVSPIGVIKSERSPPGYPFPNSGGASGVTVFSDPKLKVRKFPFFSAQPTVLAVRPLIFGQRQQDSRLFPGGGENTLMGPLKDSENNKKERRASGEVVETMEDQEADAPPEQVDGEGNGMSISEAYVRGCASDSASSSWSFLHRSYNDRAMSSPSPSSVLVESVGESVTQAFGRMQYMDDNDSEATESAPAEIVALTVVNGREGGKPEKSRNPRRERRDIPIVDSSGGDGQSELGSRAVRDRCEKSMRKKKSKRKEKVPSDDCMLLESGDERPVVQRGKRKSEKKGKGKGTAHSDGSVGFWSDRDEPGASKPRKKSSKHKKVSKQVESASNYERLALLEVKRRIKKRAKEVGEVLEQEGSDVDMDAPDPPTKRIRKERGGHQPSASGSGDAIRPPIEGISETHVARGLSTSRHSKLPANTSSDPRTKKRKRNCTASPSPTPNPIPPPLPAGLSPIPTRPAESVDAAFRRRREIENEIRRISLRRRGLSVRESGLKHELKELKFQERVEADAQGVVYAGYTCSACGEYGHNRRNSAKCKSHEGYRDWYPDR
ncbi:hypothetical protein C7212DRAFT_200683, partial [Tuber magnatum]